MASNGALGRASLNEKGNFVRNRMSPDLCQRANVADAVEISSHFVSHFTGISTERSTRL